MHCVYEYTHTHTNSNWKSGMLVMVAWNYTGFKFCGTIGFCDVHGSVATC